MNDDRLARDLALSLNRSGYGNRWPSKIEVGMTVWIQERESGWLGTVQNIEQSSVWLEPCGWVACTGRLGAFVRGEPTQGFEFERFGGGMAVTAEDWRTIVVVGMPVPDTDVG